MAVGPDILLLDEPFSALDPATRQHLRAWLRDTATRLRLTIVLVTHDVDEAVYLGSTITALDGAGATAGSWANPTTPEHDDLVAHPLRAELLASYRSQVGARGTAPAAAG
jgi:ABC-type nitrate/sulfonate/bicarbonate transport system ATPase subunit